MTYMEKFMEERPNGRPAGCPSLYGYEPKKVCTSSNMTCAECWNREVPSANEYIRAEILDTAKRIVTGDREQQYGSPEDNFATIAGFWTTYLEREVTAHDVAMMMVLLKVARIQSGQVKADNYVDLAGYAACAAEMAGGKINA